jgi:hypothetical protein
LTHFWRFDNTIVTIGPIRTGGILIRRQGEIEVNFDVTAKKSDRLVSFDKTQERRDNNRKRSELPERVR